MTTPRKSPWPALLGWAALLVLVVGGSALVTSRFGAEETISVAPVEVRTEPGMTVAAFGERHNLPNPVLKEVFGLSGSGELSREVASFGLSEETIAHRVEGALILAAEEAGKNWIKIAMKFALWFAFMGLAFGLLVKKALTVKRRLWLYALAVALFGVILGADPGPMGTLKDAIALYGESGVIFPPRMIALAAFLATILVANKFICSWGCQAGALQDLIFRLGGDGGKKSARLPRLKLPFAVTNTIRAAFFFLFTAAAFLWGMDIIHPIDPFKIFKPLALTAIGVAFLAALLAASLFLYRPWCHLFCPFGLAGWVLERFSLYKIQVDYDRCVACGACAEACPSTVMETILKREKTVADCFACGTCQNTCPKEAISFMRGKRALPPPGKFKR